MSENVEQGDVGKTRELVDAIEVIKASGVLPEDGVLTDSDTRIG